MDPSSLFKPFSPTPALLDAMHCNLCTEPFGVSPAPASVTRRALVSTACGHTFCDLCVGSLQANNYKKCSICNATVNFHSGFQRNFRLEEQQAATAAFLATIQENVRMFLDEPSMAEVIAAEAKRIKQQSLKACHTLLSECSAAAADGFYSFDLYLLTYTPLTFKFMRTELMSAGFSLLEKSAGVIAVQWHEATERKAAKLKSVADEAQLERGSSSQVAFKSPSEVDWQPAEQLKAVDVFSQSQENALQECEKLLNKLRQEALSGCFAGIWMLNPADLCVETLMRTLVEKGFAPSLDGRYLRVSWERALSGEAFEFRRLAVTADLPFFGAVPRTAVAEHCKRVCAELFGQAWELIQRDPTSTLVKANIAGLAPEVVRALQYTLMHRAYFKVRVDAAVSTAPSGEPVRWLEIKWREAVGGKAGLLKQTGEQLLAARNAAP